MQNYKDRICKCLESYIQRIYFNKFLIPEHFNLEDIFVAKQLQQ